MCRNFCSSQLKRTLEICLAICNAHRITVWQCFSAIQIHLSANYSFRIFQKPTHTQKRQERRGNGLRRKVNGCVFFFPSFFWRCCCKLLMLFSVEFTAIITGANLNPNHSFAVSADGLRLLQNPNVFMPWQHFLNRSISAWKGQHNFHIGFGSVHHIIVLKFLNHHII